MNVAPASATPTLFDFVDQAVVEGLRHVILLCFGMIDELECVRHHFLASSKGARESVSKILNAALQQGFVIDPNVFSQRSLDGVRAFSRDLKSFVERAQKVDGELAILGLL